MAARWRSLALGVLFALVAVACGGGDSAITDASGQLNQAETNSSEGFANPEVGRSPVADAPESTSDDSVAPAESSETIAPPETVTTIGPAGAEGTAALEPEPDANESTTTEAPVETEPETDTATTTEPPAPVETEADADTTETTEAPAPESSTTTTAAPVTTTTTAAPTTTTTSSTTTTTTTTAAPERLGDSNQRLVGQFTSLSGQSIDLSEFHNQDVVLWLWAPW